MILFAEDPQVVLLPTAALGHWDDVVHLQLGSSSAHLAGEPIPSKHLGLDGGPVTRTVQIPGRGVLPGLPGLVFSAPTIPVSLGDAAGSQADHCGSGHLCTSKVAAVGVGALGSREQPLKSWPWLDTGLTARALHLLGSLISTLPGDKKPRLQGLGYLSTGRSNNKET